MTSLSPLSREEIPLALTRYYRVNCAGSISHFFMLEDYRLVLNLTISIDKWYFSKD